MYKLINIKCFFYQINLSIKFYIDIVEFIEIIVDGIIELKKENDKFFIIY